MHTLSRRSPKHSSMKRWKLAGAFVSPNGKRYTYPLVQPPWCHKRRKWLAFWDNEALIVCRDVAKAWKLGGVCA